MVSTISVAFNIYYHFNSSIRINSKVSVLIYCFCLFNSLKLQFDQILGWYKGNFPKGRFDHWISLIQSFCIILKKDECKRDQVCIICLGPRCVSNTTTKSTFPTVKTVKRSPKDRWKKYSQRSTMEVCSLPHQALQKQPFLG